MEIKYQGQTLTQEFPVANGFGFKVGGGILINKKTTISIDYLALGKHDIDVVVKSGGNTQNLDGKMSVDLLTITLGLEF